MQGCAVWAAQGMANATTHTCTHVRNNTAPWHSGSDDLLQKAGVGHDIRVALLQRRQVRDDRVRERGLELAPAHAADLHQRRLLHGQPP